MGLLDDFPDVLTNGGHFLSHVPCVSFCEATPKLKISKASVAGVSRVVADMLTC